MIVKTLCLIIIVAQILNGQGSKVMDNSEETPPRYLYKVLSIENWKASIESDRVRLSSDDQDFIHFSREDQLERIITKYWSDIPQYALLKIDTSKLSGKMVYETNPGGTSKYYHLYNGFIPLTAAVEAKIMHHTELSHSDCKS